MNADDLEKLIDQTSVAKVIEMVSGIAGLKADHIAENWQDYPLAKRWQRVANKLDTVSASIRKLRL
jgi:hypothetical protein